MLHVRRWNSRGSIDTLKGLAKGKVEFLVTAGWDSSPCSFEGNGSVVPHILKVVHGSIISRRFDQAVYSSGRLMVGCGASWYYRDGLCYDNLGEHPLYAQKWNSSAFVWPPSPVFVGDSVVFLRSFGSETNYYHFLVDLIPWVGQWMANENYKQSIPVMMPIAHLPYQAEVIKRTQANIVPLPPICEDILIQSPLIFAVAFPRADNDVNPNAVPYLRSLFAAECRRQPCEQSALPQRILIRRGGNCLRPCYNEEQVAIALAEVGFVAIYTDKLTVSDQAKLFANADLIVAQHGAALANLVFSSPETIVVELIGAGWQYTMYQQISKSNQLDHHVFYCADDEANGIVVEIPKLLALLRTLEPADRCPGP
jgi:hypothetical protein